MESLLELTPYSDFQSAARAVLDALNARFGLGLWMVTRVNDDDWIVLEATEGPHYDVSAGDVMRWSDSYCSRMVGGLGPSLAIDSAQVPAYASAPIHSAQPIRCYVGVPIRRADGSLFGTLCAIDPSPGGDELVEARGDIELAGRLLATLIDWAQKLHDQERELEQTRALARVDELTGLYNRRAWDQLRSAEESRSRRLGCPACVISIDLDELKETNDGRGHAAGDELLQRAATAIRAGVRDQDVVARVGGDEFAVLLVDCNDGDAAMVRARLEGKLVEAGVHASLGLARREPKSSLDDAWQRADAAMYEQKRKRKEAARPG